MSMSATMMSAASCAATRMVARRGVGGSDVVGGIITRQQQQQRWRRMRQARARAGAGRVGGGAAELSEPPLQVWEGGGLGIVAPVDEAALASIRSAWQGSLFGTQLITCVGQVRDGWFR